MTRANIAGWRPWIVWIAGTVAFIAAMFARTSFGVAAIPAAEQFSAPVGALSVFVIVQMAFYAAMQTPAGAVLDRLGSRMSIAIGMGVMTVGQIVLAFATSFPLGLTARILIGGGDALIFSSAIRLIIFWFPPSKVAVLTSRGSGGVFAGVGEVIRMPAAQLGFFVHMLSASAPIAFTLMWGFPYLTQAQGQSDAQAGALLTIMVVSSMATGLEYCLRHQPQLRAGTPNRHRDRADDRRWLLGGFIGCGSGRCAAEHPWWIEPQPG